MTSIALAPRVTRERMFLETMERVLGKTNQIILDSKAGAVPILPLDQLRGRQTHAGTGAIAMQRLLIIGGIVAALLIVVLANAFYIVPVDRQAHRAPLRRGAVHRQRRQGVARACPTTARVSTSNGRWSRTS